MREQMKHDAPCNMPQMMHCATCPSVALAVMHNMYLSSVQHCMSVIDMFALFLHSAAPTLRLSVDPSYLGLDTGYDTRWRPQLSFIR